MEPSPVALIGLPGLAGALRAAGVEVVGGTAAFKDDANAARSLIASGTQLTVLAADRTTVGLRPWLAKVAASCPTFILRVDGGAGLEIAGATDIPLPSAFAEILAYADLEMVDDELGSAIVDGDGNCVLAETSSPSTAAAPVAVEPPAPAPSAAPSPAPSPAPAPVPAAVRAPVEPEPIELPAAVQAHVADPVVVHHPTPAPITATPVAPAPLAPAHAPVEPALAPTPASFDVWETPAPAPAPTPAPLAPVALAPAPAAPVAVADSNPWASPPPAARAREDEEDENGWDQEAATPVPQLAYVPAAPAPAPAPTPAPVPARPAPAPIETFDASDFLVAASPDTTARERRAPARGLVVPVVAGKGGVGKSSMSISIADAAATTGGLSVCLVDANRGQGDLSRYLRIRGASVPTIYDAAVGAASYDDVILGPDSTSQLRPQLLPDLPFSVILAPPDHLADPDVVTTEVYLRALDAARRRFDVVVVDTQIVEASDTSGLIDGLVIPSLVDGGWAVGLTDPSTPGVENLRHRLTAFRAAGVTSDRMLVVLNRVSPDMSMDDERFGRMYTGLGSYLGQVEETILVKNAMNAGDSPYKLGALAPMIDAICHRVTGRPEFDPARHAEPRKRRGLFGRRR
ncbi:CpaE family protein [Oerskovia sp. NPDC060338]|uniref:AAA family ATPase n=1 Tax=Oerskovia sp. NPDC060338 TaxID=3347100 RepID=UPI00364DFCE1